MLRRELDPVLDAEGVAFEQWQVLAALLAEPGQRMTQLAASSSLPAPSLTRHVDRLVERALVVRRVDPADRRSAVVALSERGVTCARRLAAIEASVAETTSAVL
jgi:DNA-binding MarR family transcriptional regulator